MIQMAASISYTILIIYSKDWPDTLVGTAVHWWIDQSDVAIRPLLFFEPWPSAGATNTIVEGMRVHRHVLAMSLLIACCSIMASKRHWPAWSATLSAKLKMAGYREAKGAELALTGYRRMVIAVAAVTYLTLFGESYEIEFLEWFYSSDWTILRAPLLIGVASAFTLLAAVCRRSAKDRCPFVSL
jgi:hypothetical protein